MANVWTIETTCDRCRHEHAEPAPRRYDGELLIPHGWLHVSGISTVGVDFVVDLCPMCRGALKDAMTQGAV